MRSEWLRRSATSPAADSADRTVTQGWSRAGRYPAHAPDVDPRQPSLPPAQPTCPTGSTFHAPTPARQTRHPIGGSPIR
ncbi:MAG: hypothetical protein MZV64_19585 [Ignavibacteriales bacterium]|nr:hypothetical protein [Ignavibacteriales bacterium]